MAQIRLKRIRKPVRLLNMSVVDSRGFYRLFEIIPGALTWTVLIGSVVLSAFLPMWAAYFIIAFDLMWLLKSFRMSTSLVRGYNRLHRARKIDWQARVEQLADIDASLVKAQESYRRSRKPNIIHHLLPTKRSRDLINNYRAKRQNVLDLQRFTTQAATLLKPRDIYHATILAVYNESIETLRPSIEALLESNYDAKKIILVIAYEARGGEQTAENVSLLEKQYAKRFGGFLAVCHPADIPGEVGGKGGNITFAGRRLLEYVDERQISRQHVVVTTLDSDNRASSEYFNYLTYLYATEPNRKQKSFQPIPMFFNNIWDVPAPVRIIATGNSFWLIIETVRPHRLRNFASHAQGLETLVDTDFWSTKTIVEDGHQFWRTYFTYNGDHQVVPVFSPIYQDAVLSQTYWRTFKNQYIQLRRWAWGVSDFPFVVKNLTKNDQISFSEKFVQIFRLLESHFTWATAPLILTFAAWLPLFINPNFKNMVLVHQLPIVASRLMTFATLGIFVTIWISMISLPPRPARVKRHRSIFMLLQWILMPVTAIIFGSFAAIDAQTRLMFGKYLEFRVTEKAVKK